MVQIQYGILSIGIVHVSSEAYAIYILLTEAMSHVMSLNSDP